MFSWFSFTEAGASCPGTIHKSKQFSGVVLFSAMNDADIMTGVPGIDVSGGSMILNSKVIGTIFLSAVSLFLATSDARANKGCNLNFTMVAENDVGSIKPGEKLSGSVFFEVISADFSDEETMSYATRGKLRVNAKDKGSVEADIRVVHVVRSPYVGDYISVDAWHSTGDLGGETRFEDPMLITFYADIGTLASYDIPRNVSDWAALSKRRTWQVHTPTTLETFYGPVVSLEGKCF